MKKIFNIIAITLFVIIFLLPITAQAVNIGDMLNDLDTTAQNAKITTQLGGAPTIYQIVGNIINIALSALGVIFLLLMIFGGIRWMTAGGNEETVKKASSLIFQAVVGLVIVLSAFLLTNFVIFRIINTTTIGNQNATTTQNIAPNP